MKVHMLMYMVIILVVMYLLYKIFYSQKVENNPNIIHPAFFK